jgi:alpha-D-ribose 1-methylphosphonate 5-triphosphate synthase subunit PhnH
MPASIAAGFDDPGRASQRHFRAVLDALAHPGRIVALDEPSLPQAVPPLMPATFALGLSLVDFETPVWLDPPLRRPEIEATLRFHCGCPLVDTPGRAAFAFVAEPAQAPPLDLFARGEPDYPDRSATVVVQVQGLEAGRGASLTGPGIDGTARLGVAGVPPRLWAELRANHARFPLGVDLLLVAGTRMAALPRTTRVEGG